MAGPAGDDAAKRLTEETSAGRVIGRDRRRAQPESGQRVGRDEEPGPGKSCRRTERRRARDVRSAGAGPARAEETSARRQRRGGPRVALRTAKTGRSGQRGKSQTYPAAGQTGERAVRGSHVGDGMPVELPAWRRERCPLRPPRRVWPRSSSPGDRHVQVGRPSRGRLAAPMRRRAAGQARVPKMTREKPTGRRGRAGRANRAPRWRRRWNRSGSRERGWCRMRRCCTKCA